MQEQLLKMRLWSIGAPAVPDQQPQPWADDGGPQRLRQVNSLARAAQGLGAVRGSGGCGACHWPESHEQGGALWCAWSQHPRMDWWSLYAHPQVMPLAVWVITFLFTWWPDWLRKWESCVFWSSLLLYDTLFWLSYSEYRAFLQYCKLFLVSFIQHLGKVSLCCKSIVELKKIKWVIQ